MPAHKRAEYLKAFADGVEVEWRNSGRVNPRCVSNWYPLSAGGLHLIENPSIDFRIKPQPPQEPDYVQIALDSFYRGHYTNTSSENWAAAVRNVIQAYEDHQKSLKELNGGV